MKIDNNNGSKSSVSGGDFFHGEGTKEESGDAVTQSFQVATDPPIDAYYDSERGMYLMQNKAGRWLSYTETQFRRRLKEAGVKSNKDADELTPLDRAMIWLHENRDVQFAAPLAGKKAGFIEENGVQMLVTISPTFIDAKKGHWDTLRKVIDGLLGDQAPVYYGWLKIGREALLAGKLRPGQALAIAGPPNCGKSLTQNLTTHILGGRAAKAAQYLKGQTHFNAELIGVEHLMLEDEGTSIRTTDRVAFGAQIKNLCVNEVQICHRKSRTPVNVKPFWRITISLNDAPEAFMVMPPMNSDVADKIILLKASKFEMPMATEDLEDRKIFWDTLMRQLPAFLDWLENEFVIPDDLKDKRYGVTSFHHPELLRQLDSLSPESHLLELIDRASLFTVTSKVWEGTAAELKDALSECSSTEREARRLLDYRNAAGTYLGRLADKYPDRVKQNRTKTERRWNIYKAT